jgi:transcriptional regulator with XRE-family HTH domain
MIGVRIKSYREGKSLKVAGLAGIIGVSQGSLSDIENGKTKPSADTLAKIVRHTDIDPRWLLTGEGNEPAKAAESDLVRLLRRIEAEGDETKLAAVRGVLAVLDPGGKKQKGNGN